MKKMTNRIIKHEKMNIAKNESKVEKLQEKIAMLKQKLAEQESMAQQNPVVEVKVVNHTKAKKSPKAHLLKPQESKKIEVDIVGLIKKEQKFNIKAWLIASTFSICSCLLGLANLILRLVK